MKKQLSKAMIISLLVTIVLVLTITICYAAGAFNINNHETWYDESPHSVSIEDVEKVSVGMTFAEIVDLLGKPKRDIGSGVWLMEWDLNTGESLIIAFNRIIDSNSEGDMVSYDIRIESKNQQ